MKVSTTAAAALILGGIAAASAQARCLPYQAVIGQARIAFGEVYSLCAKSGQSFEEWPDAKAYLIKRQDLIDAREVAAVICRGRAQDGTLPSDDEIKACLAKAGHDYTIPGPTPEANRLLDIFGLAKETR